MKTYCKSCGHNIEKHNEEGCQKTKINWIALGLVFWLVLVLGVVLRLAFLLGVVFVFGFWLVLDTCECSEVYKKPKHVHKYECVDCGEKKAIK